MSSQIAVILPHYQCEPFLAASVGSVLAQEGVDLELHVVDDGSPDSRWLQATEAFHGDSRLFLYQTSANVGPYRIKNEIAARTSAPFIAFQDADDVSAPNRLHVLLEYMRRSRAGIVGSSFFEVDETGAVLGVKRMVRYCNAWLILGKSFVSLHPTTLVRREVIDTLGGFDGTRRFAADDDFTLRAANLYPVRNVVQPLYYYRRRRLSLSHAPLTGLSCEDRLEYVRRANEGYRRRRRIRDRVQLLRSLRAPANDVPFEMRPLRPC